MKKIYNRLCMPLTLIMLTTCIGIKGEATEAVQETDTEYAGSPQEEVGTQEGIQEETQEEEQQSYNQEQLEDIYEAIAEDLGIDEKFVEYTFDMLDEKPEYFDKFPDITIDKLENKLSINNNSPSWQTAEFIECNDTSIDRTSGEYLPDALYSIMYDIAEYMSEAEFEFKGGSQEYFDALSKDVKHGLTYCYAVSRFACNGNDSSFNIIDITRAYELYVSNTEMSLMDALESCNINNSVAKDYIARAFEADIETLSGGTFESKRSVYQMPYAVNYNTRENMLLAAISVVGNVRYTWAGGHQGTSKIKGINPIWKSWEALYPDTEINEDTGEINEGYSSSIKPSGSWCPVHGYNPDERCIYYDSIGSFESYLEQRSEISEEIDLTSSKYEDLLTFESDTITMHNLDGLDCSGFVSWVFNQILSNSSIDTTAIYFTQQHDISVIPFGQELLPGDIFAWTSHIVVIVGKVKDKSKVYVTVESTPSTLRFGTVYYSGASSADLEMGNQIAREANALIGGLDIEPHSYCMNAVGNYSFTTEAGAEVSGVRGDVLEIEVSGNDTEDILEDEDEDSGSILEAEEGADEPNEASSIDEAEQGTLIEESESQENDSNTSSNVTDDTGNTDEASEEDPEATGTEEAIQTVYALYREIGRYNGTFLDEGLIIDELDKEFKDLTAQEIIGYLIKKLPFQYIDGYTTYTGELFDKSTIATELGVDIVNYGDTEESDK